jgi:hypothetical protein
MRGSLSPLAKTLMAKPGGREIGFSGAMDPGRSTGAAVAGSGMDVGAGAADRFLRLGMRRTQLDRRIPAHEIK